MRSDRVRAAIDRVFNTPRFETEQFRFGAFCVEIVQADIIRVDADAVVNAFNASMHLGLNLSRREKAHQMSSTWTAIAKSTPDVVRSKRGPRRTPSPS